MPVVILDPYGEIEERGSFLMDHVPRVPILRDENGWNRESILKALTLLVDGSLQRRLWDRQRQMTQADPTLDIWWWAPHPPEPVTFVHQLKQNHARPERMRIMHPEPPISRTEAQVLRDTAELAGVTSLELITPRWAASHDGELPGAGDLLKDQVLKGVGVGLSVSEGEDLARLGLSDSHFRLAVTEVTRAITSSGGFVLYGGHLRDGSLTMLIHEWLRLDLGASPLNPTPLEVCLAWHEHRGVSLDRLRQVQDDFGMFARFTYLDIDGEPLPNPFVGRVEGQAEFSPSDQRRALTAMRTYMSSKQQARVFIGGARGTYQGAKPGLVEEAELALRAKQPVYLAGGFGGITMDIARAFGIDDGSWAPGITARQVPEIVSVVADGSWVRPDNGLGADEDQWLAVSHRPGDIASLVASGLGRWSMRRPGTASTEGL